jgi:hypothetical protein
MEDLFIPSATPRNIVEPEAVWAGAIPDIPTPGF